MSKHTVFSFYFELSMPVFLFVFILQTKNRKVIFTWVTHWNVFVIYMYCTCLYCRCPEYEDVDETCDFLPDPKDPSCCVMPKCPSTVTPGPTELPPPASTGSFIGQGTGTGLCLWYIHCICFLGLKLHFMMIWLGSVRCLLQILQTKLLVDISWKT